MGFVIRKGAQSPLRTGEELEGATIIGEAALRVVDEWLVKVQGQQLKSLRDTFHQHTGITLSEHIGSDLDQDLNALGELRNLFAHGSDLEVTLSYSDSGQPSVEQNPVRRSLQRLRAANIISEEINQQSEARFVEIVFADSAVAYFYSRAQLIERRVLAAPALKFERGGFFYETLPDLPT